MKTEKKMFGASGRRFGNSKYTGLWPRINVHIKKDIVFQSWLNNKMIISSL